MDGMLLHRFNALTSVIPEAASPLSGISGYRTAGAALRAGSAVQMRSTRAA